jgi:hypothetical protein
VIGKDMMEKIERLVRKNKGAVEVINALTKGASFRVSVENGEDVVIVKLSDSFSIVPFGSDHRPDFTVFSNYDVISSVFDSCGGCSDVRMFLVNATKTLMNSENRKHVSLSVHAGFIKLTMNGYFKILALGGRDFLKTLREYGIDSINTIRKKLANFTNR